MDAGHAANADGAPGMPADGRPSRGSPGRFSADWLGHNSRIVILVAPVTLYLLIVFWLLFGTAGVILAIVAVSLLVSFGPRLSADTMLALYRAEPMSLTQGAALRDVVAAISVRAALPAPPALAIIPSLAVGAFSCGTGSRCAVLFTEGTLRRHPLSELTAIAAHEIAHLRAGDLPYFALADTVTRVAQALFYVGAALAAASGLLWLIGEPMFAALPTILLLAAPMLSSQLQLRLPSDHDLAADAEAARLIGDRLIVAKVASAETGACGSPLDDLRLPVPQRRVPLPSPLRCHIDGELRSQALRAAEIANPLTPLALGDGPLISLVGVGPIEMRPRDRWPGLWF